MNCDKEKLIELLLSGEKTIQCEHSPEVNCDGMKCAFCERVEIADHLIANGVTFATDTKVGDNLSPTEPMTNCQQWISVMDRLPKAGETVVAWSSKSGYQLVKWRGAYWNGIFPKGAKISVAYSCMYFPLWMPLPEPPKD